MSTPSLGDLETGLSRAWSRETSYYNATWTETNPAFGQCAVTAALAQEVLGGSIVYVLYDDQGFKDSHYFNILPNGQRVDLTRSQFSDQVRFDPPLTESNETLLKSTADFLKQQKFEGSAYDYILSFPATKARFDLLQTRYETAAQRAEWSALESCRSGEAQVQKGNTPEAVQAPLSR